MLVVEDEYLIADELVKELRGSGAEVIGPVPTLDRAIALATMERGIDAAVLDINLRGQLVYPLVDVLSARGLLIVFATGYDAGVIPAEYAGFARCEKPVTAGAITEALTLAAKEDGSPDPNA